MKRRIRSGLLACALLLTALPLGAQRSEPRSAPSLEQFVAEVARLWARGDANGVAALGADAGVAVELGAARGTVQERHAAAALRGLFGEAETVSVRILRSARAGGRPPRGFGEFAWTTRPRGTGAPQTAGVYVGAALDEGRWEIRELRVIP
ncbi:hypothetical protein BH23GEM4_BH23GEM4_08310 [soil metagenome]